MALRITIDVFSGRKNPSIELDGAEARDALDRLRPGRKLKPREIPPEFILGYRGLIIEQTGKPRKGLPKVFRLADGNLIGPDLTHRATDESFEDFFCSSTGPIRRLKLGKAFPATVRKELERSREVIRKWPWKPYPWPRKNMCKCAPPYEPVWWNVPQRQPFNNCYNYATNYRTDTFAQPGQAAGAIYSALTCAAVLPAAAADELIDSPGADNKCPKAGHLAALVIWPGGDFHWYRKGRNGYWTHKPGGTPVTNLDNSGALIADPRTADRGPYTDFCTFMVVMHGHIKIS
jgi:hypothetical protein